MIDFRQTWIVLLPLVMAGAREAAAQQAEPAAAETAFQQQVRPLLKKYCLDCHSQEAKKGSLDLERFASLPQVRQDLKPWQSLIEMLEAREMPPKDKPQPTADERQRLVTWTRSFLEAEIRARAGDPGQVPLRRLNNAEYNNTVRDLTGVDLRPAREFPADGAAGEGFANAAEALGDISPTLLNKYLNAAKDLADHVVLLPDGFRFSPDKTRQDWIDESIDRLRVSYAEFAPDGQPPLSQHLAALLRHRAELLAGKTTFEKVAAREQLHSKYLKILWDTLASEQPSFPLDSIRRRWQAALHNPQTNIDAEVAGISGEIKAWQDPLWATARVGSYKGGDTRKQPNEPTTGSGHRMSFGVKPAPGQRDVVLYLAATNFLGSRGQIVWRRPRMERPGGPALLLRDYDQFGRKYEADPAAIFAAVPDYLDLVAAAARENPAAGGTALGQLAEKRGLDPEFARRWSELLALGPAGQAATTAAPRARGLGVSPLELLSDKNGIDDQRPKVTGWRRRGADFPLVLANGSDKTEIYAGGTGLEPHSVSLFATPAEFAAAVWTCPQAASVRVEATISMATIIRGSGAPWWLEHRRGAGATLLAAGTLEGEQQTQSPPVRLQVEPGDTLVLGIGTAKEKARSDPTDVNLVVTETGEHGRVWNLVHDVADSLSAGNPHDDSLGHKGTWSFAKGSVVVPMDSCLAEWHAAASNPGRQVELAGLAAQVRQLLTGPRPGVEKTAERRLYDNLVAIDGPLLSGLDLAELSKASAGSVRYGLDAQRFSVVSAAVAANTQGGAASPDSVAAPVEEVIELRLPAGLFRDYEFVVEAALDSPDADRVVQLRLLTSPPGQQAIWDGKSPLVAAAGSKSFQSVIDGFAEFRSVFPPYVCFPAIVPTDEAVSLKLFHREDEPLVRLILDDAQRRRIDHMWEEHRFISQFPVTESKNLPLFIGFVTQDRPKADQLYFEGLREPFRRRAETFQEETLAAEPRQLDALLEFAGRAFRRPLPEAEQAEIRRLYAGLRAKNIPHDEAFRSLLARVLVSPSFLFRLEQAPAGSQPAAVNGYELAARLSYFLWSSLPDDELRGLAAAGRLHDPQVLAEQTRRMLGDERVRALAIEFGTQWVHVRGFDELREKNETLFPEFNEELRAAIYEETIRFFQDFFQRNQPVAQLLNADATFLNETLARHYGIPGVSGPEWRRVAGVKKFGRGGLLGLASVQTRQSGASRTSPVLRGNWVVETLLGEKLPPPPANVPRLPEAETGNDGLTMRQLVEKHVQVAECAVCHQRIDPFGFALEHYDPIGRWRDKDLGGLAVDAQAKLRDGTEFEGIEGLRGYLLSAKRDVFVRLFCRRLLGYALGRGVTLSDQPLVDTMVARLNAPHGGVHAAVLAIVESQQFRMIRGGDYVAAE